MSAESSSDDTHGKAWQKAEKRFSHKNASEYYDPCQDFADRSLKCMKRNGFDREMCHDYFQYVKISNPGGLVAALKSEMPETIISGSFISSLTDSLTHRAYRDCKKNWLNQKKAAPSST